MIQNNLKPVSQVLDDLRDQGYTSDFRYENNALIPFDDANRHYSQEELVLVDTYRFEGNTNPEDDAVLYLIETNDGRKGSISNGYRAFANTELDEFIATTPAKVDGTISR